MAASGVTRIVMLEVVVWSASQVLSTADRPPPPHYSPPATGLRQSGALQRNIVLLVVRVYCNTTTLQSTSGCIWRCILRSTRSWNTDQHFEHFTAVPEESQD